MTIGMHLLHLFFCSIQWYLYPPLNEVERGYTGFTLSVCQSVPPSVRLSIYLSMEGFVSTLYLKQYSLDPFHIYTSYQSTSKGVLHVKFLLQNLKFWQFFKICNFGFVLFWLGISIWINSMGNYEASQRRHPSLFWSLFWCKLRVYEGVTGRNWN